MSSPANFTEIKLIFKSSASTKQIHTHWLCKEYIVPCCSKPTPVKLPWIVKAMALSILGAGGCGTRASCCIQFLQDFNRSQMFHKNLRLTRVDYIRWSKGMPSESRGGQRFSPSAPSNCSWFAEMPKGHRSQWPPFFFLCFFFGGGSCWGIWEAVIVGKVGEKIWARHNYNYIYLNNQQWTSCCSFIQITSGIYSIISVVRLHRRTICFKNKKVGIRLSIAGHSTIPKLPKDTNTPNPRMGSPGPLQWQRQRYRMEVG